MVKPQGRVKSFVHGASPTEGTQLPGGVKKQRMPHELLRTTSMTFCFPCVASIDQWPRWTNQMNEAGCDLSSVKGIRVPRGRGWRV